MFVRNQGKYIQEMKLNIGLLLGEDKDEDAYIVLREPKTEWMMKFTKVGDADTNAQVEAFHELLPNIILKHNLTEDGEKLLTAQEVSEVLFESIGTTEYVMGEYFSAPFFSQEKRKKQPSQASAEMSSTKEG